MNRHLSLRVAKRQNSKYFYALGRHDARLVRLTGLIGLASLGFMLAGYINFLRLSFAVSLIFAPLFLLSALYYFIQYFFVLQYPGFDVQEHLRRVRWYNQSAAWKGGFPRVAVLIPAAGEPLATVEATIRAAQRIEYANFSIYLLDDSKVGQYYALAQQLGCGYLHRPNPGAQQKSGNLNYAVSKIDNIDFIMVFDADFRARPEVLSELLPYAEPDVGIVQSPQHFPLTREVYKRSKIEYGAALIQQDFYRISQVARNRFGAAICVGTNALYRVEALKRAGGFEGVGSHRGWGHSEDVYTGLKMLHQRNPSGKRYRIVYVPVQLAEGYCPDSHHSFYKQQHRWCTGSIQLIFTRTTSFSSSLSLSQKLLYSANALYYYFTISTITSPLALLVILMMQQPSTWRYTALFIPALVSNLLLIPFILRSERRPLALSLVVLSNAYTFLQAVLLVIRGRPLGWEATGAKTRGRSIRFTQFKLTAVGCFLLFYLPTLVVVLLDERLTVGPLAFLTLMFGAAFIAHVAFLYYVLIVGGEKKHRLRDRKLYAALLIGLMLIAAGTLGVTYHGRYIVEFSHSTVVSIQRLSFRPSDITSGNIVVGAQR